MNNYYAAINIPVPFIPPINIHRGFHEVELDRNTINKEFMDWLADVNLTFFHGRYFSSPPNKLYRLHSDINKADTETECVKLNIIFDSFDTSMSWYALQPNKSEIISKNTLGEEIFYYDKNDCNVLHTISVNTNCLLNGSVIHDLTNGNNNGVNRHCFSMILCKLDSKERLKWSDIEQHFGIHM